MHKVIDAWRQEFGIETPSEEIIQLAKNKIQLAESLSTDKLVQVGSALIKPDLSCIVSANLSKYADTSYPKGFWEKHDSDPEISKTGLRKGDVVIHSEIRLIINAMKSGFVHTAEEWRECLLVLSTFPCANCVSALMEFTDIEYMFVLDNTVIASPAKQEKARELLSWFNTAKQRIMRF